MKVYLKVTLVVGNRLPLLGGRLVHWQFQSGGPRHGGVSVGNESLPPCSVFHSIMARVLTPLGTQ